MRMRMQRSQRLTDCTHWTKQMKALPLEDRTYATSYVCVCVCYLIRVRMQMKALPLEDGKKERELKAAKARRIAAAARATASTEARKVIAYAYV